MYLHLGQDTVIKMDEIVGIFNMETSTISKTTRNYLAQAEKAGKVVNVSMELPKSFCALPRQPEPGDGLYLPDFLVHAVEADGVHRRNFQCLKQ